MIGNWKVRSLPRCSHHAFLSHCAEDRDRLVRPTFDALQDAGYSPWLDQHHYPAGQDPYEALREGIAHCRHVVYFVTGEFLGQGRGWNSVENAYANLLQVNLHAWALELCHVQLPLIFLPQNHVTLRRSAWGPLIPRARFYPGGRVNAGGIGWAAREIIDFIKEQERRGPMLAVQVQNDPGFRPLLDAEPNLLRRVMCADPPPVP